MSDEEDDPSPTLQPRATDYLSAAVEQRAKGRAAIAAGETPPPTAPPPKVPAVSRRTALPAMDSGDDEPGLKLRPTKGTVTPVPMAELMPTVKISAEQEEILSRIAPSAPRRAQLVPGAAARAPRAPELAPPSAGARRTRAVEMPEPGEGASGRRQMRAPEWDRYYNPGIYAGAKIPRLPIERQGPAPTAPAWELIGRPRGAGVVTDTQAPYRASLKEGAAIKDLKPQREVERFLAQRRTAREEEPELLGPSEVPETTDRSAEASRKAEFEAAMADLERSFREGEIAAARPPPAVASPSPATRRTDAAVQAAAERAMPYPRTSTSPDPPRRAIARSRSDSESEEDENEAAAADEEEPPIGRQPPPDRLAEQAAHRALAHDATGASLCPTCGRRISPHNAVLVCTSCGRVACATCGKFSAGEPTGNIYQYEYKFQFPLCQPCFERHFGIQKNLARAKAYLASGNMTYAYYHAQTALQTDTASPYVADADALIKQVESRRAQMQKADKQWEEARKKIMRERTTVLK